VEKFPAVDLGAGRWGSLIKKHKRGRWNRAGRGVSETFMIVVSGLPGLSQGRPRTPSTQERSSCPRPLVRHGPLVGQVPDGNAAGYHVQVAAGVRGFVAP
jgi:hypothetical protein